MADRATVRRSQDPKDAVQDTAVVHTRDTARLVRQHRLDGRPLVVGEFVAHDSRLRFGHLNHALGDAIPQRAHRGRCQCPDFTSAFRSIVLQKFFDISTRNKDSMWSDSANLIQRQPLADSIVSQGRGAMAREFRSASRYMRFGRIRPILQRDYATLLTTHMIGRRSARLTPAAPPSVTHPRRSRGPPAGGSGANP